MIYHDIVHVSMPRDDLKVLTLAAKSVRMSPEAFMLEATKISLEKLWEANAAKADSARTEKPAEPVVEENPNEPGIEVEPE